MRTAIHIYLKKENIYELEIQSADKKMGLKTCINIVNFSIFSQRFIKCISHSFFISKQQKADNAFFNMKINKSGYVI